jgi:Xaa-Pro aminopeptidase
VSADAVLLVGDTISNPDLRHAVPAVVADPVVYLEQGGEKTVWTSEMDAPVLRQELPGLEVASFEGLGGSPAAADGSGFQPYVDLTVRAARSRGIRRAVVPPEFPLAVGRALSAAGIELVTDEWLFVERRRVKSTDELEGARRACRATEAGWEAIRVALRDRPAVSCEELKQLAALAILKHDAIPSDVVIVAHGSQTAIPHDAGSGPVGEGEPVIADLMARDRQTGMHADVTRTFCVGEPPPELVRFFELCQQAMDALVSEIRPGARGDDLSATMTEILGRARTREFGSDVVVHHGEGFGHGVGLRIHEVPILHADSAVELVAGEICSIEPAIYLEGFGGCRLEDMILVTADGCELITRYEYGLEP